MNNIIQYQNIEKDRTISSLEKDVKEKNSMIIKLQCECDKYVRYSKILEDRNNTLKGILAKQLGLGMFCGTLSCISMLFVTQLYKWYTIN